MLRFNENYSPRLAAGSLRDGVSKGENRDSPLGRDTGFHTPCHEIKLISL